MAAVALSSKPSWMPVCTRASERSETAGACTLTASFSILSLVASSRLTRITASAVFGIASNTSAAKARPADANPIAIARKAKVARFENMGCLVIRRVKAEDTKSAAAATQHLVCAPASAPVF